MLDREFLHTEAAKMGVALSAGHLDRLDMYARLLIEWNEKINLTAITQPREMAVKHFLDSLTLLPLLPDGPFSLIDVGTGAGFPGVPLALLRPDCSLTLLDSLNKRLVFLKELTAALGIPAALVHMRAEQGGRDISLRERFDVATARAVAALPALCEYCLPFVKVGGRFLAMKGPDVPAELAQAAGAIHKLGGASARCVDMALPAIEGEAQARTVVIIRKHSPTPGAYPRPSAKIAKHPLLS